MFRNGRGRKETNSATTASIRRGAELRCVGIRLREASMEGSRKPRDDRKQPLSNIRNRITEYNTHNTRKISYVKVEPTASTIFFDDSTTYTYQGNSSSLYSVPHT